MKHPLAQAECQRSPYRFYRRLREEHPIFELETESGCPEFFLTRYADVERVLQDGRFSVNRLHAATFLDEDQALPADLGVEQQAPSMLNLDPPDHTRIRGLVSRAFTPRRVESLESAIENRATGLLDSIDSEPAFDLIAGFAGPLPAMVIADLLGVPESDHAKFRDWSGTMLRTLVDGSTDLMAFREARDQLEAYLETVVTARRARPEDDLISALVVAEEHDALTNDELLASCMLMLVAGHETTTNAIANGVWLLHSKPGLIEQFLDHPETAFEELIRLESPIQGIARVTTESVELGGVLLPAGALVSAMLAAANRDPEIFLAPDAIDLERSSNPHLAFGKGVHFCLGASLARLEARIALTTLFERLPGLRLADPKPRWRRSALLRGFETLQLANRS